MAHTTYPTPVPQFQAVHSFDPSLPQPSAHIQLSMSPYPQLSGTPQFVFPAHRRYSSFPHISTSFPDLAADRTATEQPSFNDHEASYQQLNFFEGQHGCAFKVEDSPPILFEASCEVSLVSGQTHVDEGYTQCPTGSQERTSVKSSSSVCGSSDADSDADSEAAPSPLPKRGKACCGAIRGGGRWKAQDPESRFVICKYGEREGQICGAIIKVFRGRRSQLQNHLYEVHWNGDKTGTAECLWGPPNHACPSEVPMKKEAMARHILDSPHSFGDRDDEPARKIVFNDFLCPYCGKSFCRSDSMFRHVTFNRCGWK